MKLCFGLALLMSPSLVWAQDQVEELKRQMERRLKEMEENYNRERAKIKEEFDRQMRAMKERREPERKEPRRQDGGGGADIIRELAERIEKRLADLGRRLENLEQRMRERPGPGPGPGPGRDDRRGPPERIEKFFRFGDQDWGRWMEEGRRFWEGHDGDALRRAAEELKRMIPDHKGELRERLQEAAELLRRIVEEAHERRREGDRREEMQRKEHREEQRERDVPRRKKENFF
jgi:hypothetical protein